MHNEKRQRFPHFDGSVLPFFDCGLLDYTHRQTTTFGAIQWSGNPILDYVTFRHCLLCKEQIQSSTAELFKGKALTAIDTTLIVSILYTVIVNIFHIDNALLWALLLFLVCTSFEFHSLFSVIKRERSSR